MPAISCIEACRVRTLPLFGRIGTEMAADYLSGMLIGDEIRATAPTTSGSTTVMPSSVATTWPDVMRVRLRLAGLKSRMAPYRGPWTLYDCA